MMKGCYWLIFISLLLSCDKVKQQQNKIEGLWTLNEYHEFIHDSSIKQYEVVEGETYFQAYNKKPDPCYFGINFNCISKEDTISQQFSGCYRIDNDKRIVFEMSADTVLGEITHSSKNHLVFRARFMQDLTSVLSLKRN
ncbi:MAG: hypothetical protein ACI9XP_000033 [Lentimonas sp.]|jgi:hypothetical protein